MTTVVEHALRRRCFALQMSEMIQDTTPVNLTASIWAMMPMFRVALDSVSDWSGACVDSSLRGVFTLCRTIRRAHTHPIRIPAIAQMRLKKRRIDLRMEHVIENDGTSAPSPASTSGPPSFRLHHQPTNARLDS
jgi:hypothetical protein